MKNHHSISIVISILFCSVLNLANAQQTDSTIISEIAENPLQDSCRLITENYIQLADSCILMNNTLEALKLYEQAYALDSTAAVMRKIIDCHYKRGNFQKCIQLHDSICKDSLNILDMRLKYYCYSNLSQHDSALVYGRMVNKLNPQDYNVVVKLANYYNEIKQPGNAIQIIDRYCLTDSTNIFVNRQKAYAYYQMEDYTLALNEYKKLAAAGDTSDMHFYHTALCYENLDSLYQSYDNILLAANLNGLKNPYIVAKLGLITRDIGRPAEAIEIINRSKELLYPSDEMLYTLSDALSDCYKREKDYKKAIKYMKECLQYTQSPYVLYKIAQLYFHEKDLLNEKKYYQLFLDKIKDVPNLSDAMLQLKEYAQECIKTIDEELFFQDK